MEPGTRARRRCSVSRKHICIKAEVLAADRQVTVSSAADNGWRLICKIQTPSTGGVFMQCRTGSEETLTMIEIRKDGVR